MKLTGIELRSFRSIGDDSVVLKPWRKCNILIGQNNAGKSNVIKAIQRISDRYRKDRKEPSSLTDLDLHKRSPGNQFLFRLYFQCDVAEEEELAKLAKSDSFYFDFAWKIGQPTPAITDHYFAQIQDFTQANRLMSYLLERTWSVQVGTDTIRNEFLKYGENIFPRFAQAIPLVHIIPEFRQIRSGSQYSLDGTNLTQLLHKYQHPEIGNDQDREKFDLIERFVQELLHLPEAKLEVSHNEDTNQYTIILGNNGIRLPLSSYGTGVHELVILVTAVLSIENAICCIEEPEIHLHPRLQREFIDFIITETSNQYLISTHSPTFINAVYASDDVQVFYLRLEDGTTVGGPILSDSDSLCALNDLGVKASDILQANCIIWVEGPSDRIYLKRWLELITPELVEGRDYSIMFYGGRLLSHLSADRDKVPDELIRILRINQNAVVVMDSDRGKIDERLTRINQTKRRIRDECERNGGICWITDGREVENYLL